LILLYPAISLHPDEPAHLMANAQKRGIPLQQVEGKG
jgi:hypothetical protein